MLKQRTFSQNIYSVFSHYRSSCWQMFFKIGVLKIFAIFSGKQLCWSLFLMKLQVRKPATLLKKYPTQVFSCEFCEIFKNRFFY